MNPRVKPIVVLMGSSLLAEMDCLPGADDPRRYDEVQWPECHPDDSWCPRPPEE